MEMVHYPENGTIHYPENGNGPLSREWRLSLPQRMEMVLYPENGNGPLCRKWKWSIIQTIIERMEMVHYPENGNGPLSREWRLSLPQRMEMDQTISILWINGSFHSLYKGPFPFSG